jgi:hypothetical protein
MRKMEALLLAILGGLVGGILAFPLANYQMRLQTRRELKPLGVKLGALAIRAGHEVLNQFVKIGEGPWIPDALRRQNYLLEDMDRLMPMVEAHGGDLQILFWAAREALESNIVILDSWVASNYNPTPPLPPVDHISTEVPSHLDLFAAADLLARAVESIRARAAKKNALRFAERMADLRNEAAAERDATIKYLQSVDRRAQLKGVYVCAALEEI